jgi:hypothetical protein
MAVFMGAFPVMPGKEDEARKFAKETVDHEPEFRASQERSGVTRESSWTGRRRRIDIERRFRFRFARRPSVSLGFRRYPPRTSRSRVG